MQATDLLGSQVVVSVDALQNHLMGWPDGKFIHLRLLSKAYAKGLYRVFSLGCWRLRHFLPLAYLLFHLRSRGTIVLSSPLLDAL